MWVAGASSYCRQALQPYWASFPNGCVIILNQRYNVCSMMIRVLTSPRWSSRRFWVCSFILRVVSAPFFYLRMDCPQNVPTDGALHASCWQVDSLDALLSPDVYRIVKFWLPEALLPVPAVQLFCTDTYYRLHVLWASKTLRQCHRCSNIGWCQGIVDNLNGISKGRRMASSISKHGTSRSVGPK